MNNTNYTTNELTSVESMLYKMPEGAGGGWAKDS